MGLDSVVLIQEVEEKFEIGISDSDAEKIATVGDFLECIIRCIKEKNRGSQEMIDDGEIWSQFKNIIINVTGAESSEVTPNAHLVNDIGLS